MSENEDFHLDFLPRFIDAQRAFHDGDPEPNMALWAVAAPVTLFAARGLIDSGTESVTRTFQNVAATFSDVGTFEWQPLAEGVHGDFAYTVAVERYTNSRDGGPLEQTELRATHVYRREDGKWRAVHRHADRRPPDRGDGFNAAIEAVRDALRQYVKGDPEPALAFFSDRDDVTLANPLDPPRRGPTGVREGARRGGGQLPSRRTVAVRGRHQQFHGDLAMGQRRPGLCLADRTARGARCRLGGTADQRAPRDTGSSVARTAYGGSRTGTPIPLQGRDPPTR